MFLIFFLGTLSDMLDTLDESLSFEGTVILTFFGFTFVIDDSHLFLLLEFLLPLILLYCHLLSRSLLFLLCYLL